MANASILAPEGHTLTDWERAFFRDSDPYGFIVFARHVDTPAQLCALTSDLRDTVGRDAPILIDQEGGRVQRMRAPHWREWLPPLDQMAQARDPMRTMWLRNRIIAAELRAAGIDANCAPCADIAGADTHPFLRNRCYGEDGQTVIAASRAAADGLLHGGVIPIVKHIPGHGRATVDSHKGLPYVTESHVTLMTSDFHVFAELSDLPMGMTAHIVFDQIDPDTPATLSKTMNKVIRNDIGFAGLLMTDDISMGALQGGIGDLSRDAIAAGCDIVLHCNGDASEMMTVVASVGDVGPRGAEALHARKTPVPVDIAALSAELNTLLG